MFEKELTISEDLRYVLPTDRHRRCDEMHTLLGRDGSDRRLVPGQESRD